MRVIVNCCLLMACVLVALVLPALASEASAPTAVALTVYNDNLALIRETRDFELSGGTQTLTLSEVSGMLRPETVHLSFGDGTPFSLLEQNYDYDLVNSAKLLEKFIGKQIILVDDANKTQRSVKLLSTAGGMVVEADGSILLNPPGRVELPRGAADNLLLRPTLSWLLDSPAQGRHTGEISYLSHGLSWSADYVLLLAADDKSAGLEGWVTLSNTSGTTYSNAQLKLVAGQVHHVPKPDEEENDVFLDRAYVKFKQPEGFIEEPFFEYHLYDLQRSTTIKNSQQKQLRLLSVTDVPVKKLFLMDVMPHLASGVHQESVRVMVQFRNDEQSGLGMPLPAGVVRLFKQDSKGQAQIIGEDNIEHTPKDEDVRIHTGNAFDVMGQSEVLDFKERRNGATGSTKVTLKNHKQNEDITVTVSALIGQGWTITASNFEYLKKDANTAEFNIPVPADGEVELTYSYKVVWR